MRMPFAIVGCAVNERELQAAMDATVIVSRSQLETGDVPRLIDSGVVYERETKLREPRGVERFQSARDAYLLGHADCDGLAPWLVAERQLFDGEPCRAKVVQSGDALYHVLLEYPDGRRVDPSAYLGMLDGVGVGEDASVTARARRRRRIRALKERVERLVRAAADYGAATPQGAAIREALDASVRELRGLATQDAADRAMEE